MKEVKGLTLKEIAGALNIPENTAKVRIFRADIEPLFRGALYPLDTIDRIRDAPMGRPAKKKDKEE
jgi:predicted RNA polymerase sigma factor